MNKIAKNLNTSMKRALLIAAAILSYPIFSSAQKTAADVNKVVEVEKSFDRLVERKGIKDAFLEVADPEGIVFKPHVI